jgi:hypothetical protein
MTKVRELLDIPDQVRKMDFTVALTEGVAHPKRTVDSYVVTPRIADAFDQALGMIDGSLRDGRSAGAYLHGSFGSGKSHFMAVLSLLLSDEEVAWKRREFHDLRTKYAWVGKKKVLELQMHLLGKDSLEDAIYPAYLEYLDQHHPDAPTPGVFADEDLFDNAAAQLDRMGDDAFFGPMNDGRTVDEDDGWGEGAAADLWARDTFDEARASTDPKRRAELLHALLQTHFQAFRSSARAYKELDEGLWTLSQHAKDLGYDVVVLFLDELILRMSMGASQPQWLNDMVMSMIKLVESTHSNRAIPIVSYIARQRALQEMVGDQLAGPDSHRLQHALSLARGRFGQIDLPNEELPAIVEQRVLRPIDDGAKKKIDAAFELIQKSASGAWATLTAGKYDAKNFRRLYPFSPSLVETLVDLSSSLQRQRTSIKLLTEILVEHIDDLELGTLVGVGDLFDLLASGDESAQGIMRERFRAAVSLYKHELLPMIQGSHGTTGPDRCQRMRDDHALRLGCANCAERPCRNDNRVAKTLLIAALAPNSAALKDLTVGKLVELNHGHIRTPIPGQEKQAVATKLRKWASDLHQIQVGRQDDPGVSIELHGVDLKPIMEQASAVNSPARRQTEIRRMLFEAMGVDADVETGVDQQVEWRGSRRLGHVRFGNVRALPPQVLRCPDDHDWRLIVDFPFDEEGHGPEEDEASLAEFRDKEGGSWTLVWLPSFFSQSVNTLLGELVILGHILDENDATRQGYIKHLSPEQQDMAVHSMRTLQQGKRTLVFEAMRKAYGVASAGKDDEHLDPSRRMGKHLHTLQAGLQIHPGLAPDLSHALQRYVPALLEERYPLHPQFPRVPTKKRIADVLGWFDDLMDREDHKIGLDKHAVEEMRGYLGELGFVRVTENAALLREDATIQSIEKKRMQKSVEHPTAGQVAAWFDEDDKFGLQPEAMAMVVRAYARAKARTLVAGGQPFEFVPGKPIPDSVVLEKPDLPSPSEWAAGLEMAGYLGITLPSKALHGDNLKRFERDLGARIKEVASAASKLPGHLRAWHEVLELPENTSRLTTADSAEALVTALQGKPGVEQIRVLGSFEAQTSEGALGRSLGSAVATTNLLGNKLTLGVFRQLQTKRGEAEVAHLLGEAIKCLRQDEVVVVLATRLEQLAEQGQGLLEDTPPATTPPPQPKAGVETVLDAPVAAEGSQQVIAALEQVLGQARQLAAGGDDLSIAGRLTITRKRPS